MFPYYVIRSTEIVVGTLVVYWNSLFCSQCYVCEEQMVPPTWTIREDDRNEMFIRRHIDIPAESRCCKGYTVDDHLTRD